MTQVQVTQGVLPGQRFSADAFDGSIGKQVPLMSGDPAIPTGTATLVAAVVNSDGTSALLTLDLPDGLVPSPLTQLTPVRGGDELRLRSNPRSDA